ncbi:energy transducer TonB [Polynucleobacter sp.]|jgi:TonB family protein|uniref:energy transducer TonB n=1 Tax=Polynucleobacter sp. TaxID=2029855 RepID=UPI0037CBDD18
MPKELHHSLYLRTGFVVFALHALSFIAIFVLGYLVVEQRPKLVFLGEIIEFESAVISKQVVKQSTAQNMSPKENTPLKRESPEGTEQLNKVQENAPAAAPISAPSADSKALNNPKPPYPISSRENGEQGRVLLNACINDKGEIDRLDLAKTSGHPALDRSALNTVQHWRFIPAQQGGGPIPLCYRLPINFVLSAQ